MPSQKVLTLCRQVEPSFAFRDSDESDSVGASPAVLPDVLDRGQQSVPLFDYQRDLSRKAVSVLGERRRALISLPTGCGKTRTGVAAILELFSQISRGQLVWLAPTLELLDQAHRAFIDAWKQSGSAPDLSIGRTPWPKRGHHIWLATPAAVNLESAQALRGFEFVVFDEAHQLAAETYTQAVQRISSVNGRVGLVGLSATPGRTQIDEVRQLAELFDRQLIVSSILGDDPVKFMQDRGVLARLKFHTESSVPASTAARVRRVAEICGDLQSNGEKVILFAASLQEAEAVTHLLKFYGHSSWFVEGNLSEGARVTRLKEFAASSAGVLTNQKLLTTGYDCPSVAHVVLGGKVGTPIMFEQMVGRAIRGPLTGGTRVANVWQFVDHVKMHGSPQAYLRFLDGEWEVKE